MVSELFTLAAQKHVEKALPGFRRQQWYFFAVAAFFAYGRLLKGNLLREISSSDSLNALIGARRRGGAAGGG